MLRTQVSYVGIKLTSLRSAVPALAQTQGFYEKLSIEISDNSFNTYAAYLALFSLSFFADTIFKTISDLVWTWMGVKDGYLMKHESYRCLKRAEYHVGITHLKLLNWRPYGSAM